MTTTAIASLPPLANTPSLDIDAGDVSLSRIKIAQHSTKQVQNKAIKLQASEIYASTSEDDATVLYDPEDKKSEGVLIHVLGMTKGKSHSEDGGGLERWAFNDPSAPPEAWVTYDFLVHLPESDDPFPYKWLMTKSGAPAAKAINTVLKKNQGRGPAWNCAFRITTAEKKNDKGMYYVPVVTQVEPDEKHIEAAGQLASMIGGSEQVGVAQLPPASAPEI